MTMSLVLRRFALTIPKLQDVVIVGGGPAGLSMLTGLKNSPKTGHLLCKLVEPNDLTKIKQFESDQFTNRIVSLTTKTMRFMQKIGSWDQLDFNRIQFYNNIIAFDNKFTNHGPAFVEFDNSSLDNNPMAAMCETINIQKSLLLRLEELEEYEDCIIDNVKVESITAPDDGNIDWPVITLSNGEVLQTRLLIGADGYNSPVRKFSGIQSRGWNYDSIGVVGVIKFNNDTFNLNAYQRFLSSGPIALLPLPNDQATFVWSIKNEKGHILKSITNDDIFVSLLNAAIKLDEVDLDYVLNKLAADPNDFSVIDDIGWRLSALEPDNLPGDHDYNSGNKLPFEMPEIVSVQPKSRAAFPLKMAHVDSYISHRVALLGDAAHTIHPLAGQGLNLGQNDVRELLLAVETAVDRGLDIGSPLALEPYFSNTYPYNHAVIGACDKFHKVFSFTWTPLVWSRLLGIKAFNSLSPIKNLLVKNFDA